MPVIYIGMKANEAGKKYEIIIPDINLSINTDDFDDIENIAMSIIEDHFSKDGNKKVILLRSIDLLVNNKSYKEYYWKPLRIKIGNIK